MVMVRIIGFRMENANPVVSLTTVAPTSEYRCLIFGFSVGDAAGRPGKGTHPPKKSPAEEEVNYEDRGKLRMAPERRDDCRQEIEREEKND